MSKSIDFEVLELLTSKICHDLISPIGAINNGLEILDDVGPDSKDVTDLIAFSAAQASAKLQAFRMAYGAGGGDSSIKAEDVHKAVEAMVGAEKKIRQNWDPHAKLGPEERPDGFAKMLICGFLLAIEGLPKGGTIAARGESADTITITAEGPDANFRAGTVDALTLATSREKLEPKFVHAYVSGLIAGHYGYKIAITESGSGRVSLKISCP